MKTENCPICGKQPTTISAAGWHITCCLGAEHEKNGQSGNTITESKRGWNAWVARAVAEATAPPSKE